MHATDSISAGDFEFQLHGQQVCLDDVFPGFHPADRIGVVVNGPCRAMGVSALLMAATTRFYDVYRPALGNAPDKLRIYPDYFIFHVGQCQGNHAQLDVWPPHKEVMVDDDAEQILEAINDRGITRLLVEEKPLSSGIFLRETLSSARNRIVSALAFSATGRVANGDVCGAHDLNVEAYVRKMIGDSCALLQLSEQQHAAMLQMRACLAIDGRVVEHYRRLTVERALGMLTENKERSPQTQHYIAASNKNAATRLAF
ncbi:hypothetical protein [Aquitalea sp. LB_tupeE]|uniref:hypothetical protein n=1 Tax=Aquitalea sp. LB_tupeE TaxID=2748078 RepID=UPI0015BF5EBD|nr:hypothetical protein [Aquitalea sp. LB_tupeE]NWK80147.1 hypothetical protein [Aquitalea sp. LB_tupeE]